MFGIKVASQTGAFAVSAVEPFIKGAASRYSKSTDTFYGVSYFYADPLVDQTIDDDVITLTNRLIFAFLPTGWFRQNLAEKIDADINLFQQQGTMIEQLSFVDPAVFKNGKYNFIFGESSPSLPHAAILKKNPSIPPQYCAK